MPLWNSGILLLSSRVIHMHISFPTRRAGFYLFVCFEPYLWNSLFCAGEPENNRQQLQWHKTGPETPICSASARPLAAVTFTKKNKINNPDNRHLFLFHATETPLLRRPSWRRREQRLLSDAAAVIGFLNATPRTMGPLSRPAIGNLCATAAARKHPAHVHVHTPVEMLTCAGINKKWQRSREGRVCFAAII